jgi:hypothetical protein
MRGRNTCHMHGGRSKGAITLKGKEQSRLAAFRHGKYTQEALSCHKETMTLIRRSKNLLQSLE